MDKEPKENLEDRSKWPSKELIGKEIIGAKGKKFGKIGDLVFEVKSGELIHLVVAMASQYTEKLELERDKDRNILIPFSAVEAIGDFVVIVEEDLS